MFGSESLSPFWMYNGVLGMGNGRAFKVSELLNCLCKLQEPQMVECVCREINRIGIESQLYGNGFKFNIKTVKILQIMSKSSTITTKTNAQKEKVIDAKD